MVSNQGDVRWGSRPIGARTNGLRKTPVLRESRRNRGGSNLPVLLAHGARHRS